MAACCTKIARKASDEAPQPIFKAPERTGNGLDGIYTECYIGCEVSHLLLLSRLRLSILTLTAASLLATSLAAQTAPSPGKTFDIVSIRQNKTGGQSQMQFGPTANGYEARSLPPMSR
jgi:hypothetical protein